jgi:hypothetical protein
LLLPGSKHGRAMVDGPVSWSVGPGTCCCGWLAGAWLATKMDGWKGGFDGFYTGEYIGGGKTDLVGLDR